MKQENTNRCTRCGREEKKDSEVLLINLTYSFGGKGLKIVNVFITELQSLKTVMLSLQQPTEDGIAIL